MGDRIHSWCACLASDRCACIACRLEPLLVGQYYDTLCTLHFIWFTMGAQIGTEYSRWGRLHCGDSLGSRFVRSDHSWPRYPPGTTQCGVDLLVCMATFEGRFRVALWGRLSVPSLHSYIV